MLKVIELFAGVGSQTQALKNIGVNHEVIGISEIDKYAISSYMQLHGETKNFGDISKIDVLPGADLWTYSFPCQDLSVAGKGAGIKKGTRSGLLLEVERLLEVSEKPKYLLMENVKNLVGKKNKSDFDEWCKKLEELGYKNYWQVLNAKDYEIPQNRERVFMISILGDHKPYIFPEKKELKIKLKDVLENEVDEKYYLSEKLIQSFIKHKERHTNKGTGFLWQPKILEKDFVANCLRANAAICPTDNSILIKNATKKGYLEAVPGDYINLQFPESQTRRGRVQKEVAATLMCNDSNGVLEQDFRIRKLTPRECWRLMGWKDEEFNKIKGISNSQLYKQAGNGIVVNVLEAIFKNLFY